MAPTLQPGHRGDARLHLPASLAWLGADGIARRETRLLPDGPVARAATAILARGTALRGPSGPVAVEDVRPGCRVAARGGWARVIWTGAREAADAPLLRVAAGAFGAVPDRPLLLGHAAFVLLDDPRCLPLVGARLALAPLDALGAGHDVARLWPPGGAVTVGIAAAGLMVLDASGLGVATAHPAGLAATGAWTARDLALAFPALAAGPGFAPAATPCLSHAEARAMARSGPLRAARMRPDG